MLCVRQTRSLPCTLKSNGNANPFIIQALLRKWAYAMPSRRNSDTAAADLPM